jgi:hypothetical protein
MNAAQVQSQVAGHLVETVLGQSQRAQTDMAMKLAKISLQQSLQSPPSTASVSGQGGGLDVVG